MTQGLETMIQTSVDKTVSGFLSAIKAGMQACGTSGNMFASLLSEAENNRSTVEPYQQASASAKTVTTASDDNDGETAAREQNAAPAQNAAKSAERSEKPVLAEKREAQPAERADVDQEDNAQDTASEGAEADGADGQDALALRSSKQDEKDETAEGEDDAEDSEAMAALLGVVVPLEGAKAARAETAVDGAAEKTAAATAQADGETLTQEQKEALKTLSSIHQDLVGEASESTDSQDAARTKHAVDTAVKEIASKILTLKDVQGQTVNAQQTSAMIEGADKQTKTALEGEGVLEEISSAQKTDATAQTATQQKVQDIFGFGSLAASEAPAAQTTATQAPQIVAAALAGTAEAAGEQAGTSKTTSANQNILGSGVKTVGSYDAAGQLSAARVSKGGATGLPQMIEQVSVQLNKAAKNGVDTITVQLKPAELGKIEIKLEFAADKSVTGTVTADNQATLTLLQKDSSALQRALQEAGLQAQTGCLEFTLRDQRGNEGQLAQQNNGQGTQGGGSSDATSAQQKREAEEAAALAAGALETYYLTPGRVNLSV